VTSFLFLLKKKEKKKIEGFYVILLPMFLCHLRHYITGMDLSSYFWDGVGLTTT
jgi:hypothetical protein